jgi:hypothetical protein
MVLLAKKNKADAHLTRGTVILKDTWIPRTNQAWRVTAKVPGDAQRFSQLCGV